ncbi:MAG: ribonuclease P protein component [Patescibacteria group bacterium]|nr:ribonuclease P protein component [Patescibacteria group bacterium]
MLPKNKRLNLGKKEGYSIFSSSLSKSFKTTHFKIFYRKAKVFKTAVIIPKKNVQKAVLRNKLKRKIYGIIEENEDVDIKVSLVLFLRRKDSNLEELNQEIRRIFKKINEKSNF